jgi:hypothetical protein
VQPDLPIIVGEPVPILHIQMDGHRRACGQEGTAGRTGKLDGLPAHTREIKLGCGFTQATRNHEGFAIRDGGSTPTLQFGKRLYVEAWKRGWGRAAAKLVTGDGAE